MGQRPALRTNSIKPENKNLTINLEYQLLKSLLCEDQVQRQKSINQVSDQAGRRMPKAWFVEIEKHLLVLVHVDFKEIVPICKH